MPITLLGAPIGVKVPPKLAPMINAQPKTKTLRPVAPPIVIITGAKAVAITILSTMPDNIALTTKKMIAAIIRFVPTIDCKKSANIAIAPVEK